MFKRNFYLDEKVFNVLDNINSYWLGFLWGDGYINGNRLQLALSYKDYDHLVKFKNFMKSKELNIRIFNSKCKETISKSCEIRFRSWKIHSDLEKYKITLNKNIRGKIPNIFYNKNVRRIFLRGLFDADGCFTINGRGYLFAEITGEIETMLYVKKLIEKDLGMILNIVKNGSIYRIRFSASNTIKLGDYIYKDKTDDEFLSRKYDKFINHKDNMKKENNGRLYTKKYYSNQIHH